MGDEAKAIDLTELTFRRLVLASIIPAFLAVIILALGAREVATASKGIAPPRLTWAGVDKRFKFFMLAVILFTLGNSSDSFYYLAWPGTRPERDPANGDGIDIQCSLRSVI